MAILKLKKLHVSLLLVILSSESTYKAMTCIHESIVENIVVKLYLSK